MDTALVNVNISGRRFKIPKILVNHALENSLSSTPNTTMFNVSKDEYYFARNVGCFEAVLDYLSLNELHMPLSVCPAVFKREMDFWGIDVQELQSCCKLRLDIFLDEVDVLNQQHQISHLAAGCVDGRETWRGFLHKSLESPSYSAFAKVYFWIAMTFVVLSIFVLCAETLPDFRSKLSKDEWRDYFGADYDDYYDVVVQSFGDDDASGEKPRRNVTSGHKLPMDTSTLNIHISRLSIACGIFFSVDILLRFCVARNKIKFFISFLNIVDLIAVVAFYCRVVLVAVFPKLQYTRSYTDFATCIGCFRAFRVFRLVGQSRGLYVFLLSLKSGIREIWLLGLFLCIGMLIFSSFLYIFERPNNIDSIPSAFWWSIITMTTVGYGDVVPKSTLGKMLGSLCAVSGVLVMAVTVPLFANKFALYYHKLGHLQTKTSNKPNGNRRSFITPLQHQSSLT